MKLKALNHSVYNLNIHLILVTKYRVCCLDAAMLTKLSELVTTLAKAWHCELLEFNGERPCSLIINLSPTEAPAALVNNLKTVSAMTLRREFPLKLNRHFWRFKGLWSRSYCAISCGGAPLEALKYYIKNQDRPSS